MKCIECGKESTKKDRGVSGGRCSACYHAFVTEPLEDCLTDMAIKSAEDVISSNGSVYFLKDHLKYQLHRKLNKTLKWCTVATLILLLVFLVILIFSVIKGGVFTKIAMASGFSLLVPLSINIRYKKAISKLDTLIDRWIDVNPHEKLLTAEKFQALQSSKPSSDVDNFEGVLICERNETANFFLSNSFHTRYSCAVLNGNAYPEGDCADMLLRLKQTPNLKVFLLHDHSPAGNAFSRRIKTDPKWFGGQKRITIVDLGLNINQKHLFNSMTIKQIDRNKKVKETAEVALFQPVTLMELCGAAIDESVPFDLMTTPVATNNHA